jgi:cell wall-associated NlpC family hydrolase
MRRCGIKTFAIVFCALLAWLATGCAPAPELIRDVRVLDQDAFSLIADSSGDSLLVRPEVSRKMDARFDSLFFACWNAKGVRISRADALWGFRHYRDLAVFGENKRKRPAGWVESLASRADTASYPNRRFLGITVANSNLRVLPTDKPAFLDFKKPGEGYPFDYLQVSSLAANTPLTVLHATQDGSWLFVDTPVEAGWVPAADVAFVDWAFQWQWETGIYAAVIEDEAPVRTDDGRFLFHTTFGSILPFLYRDSAGVHVLAAMADAQGNAVLTEAVMPSSAAEVKPVPLTARNLAKSVDSLLGQAYGWRGLYGDRDCSATVRDMFVPFGIFLPRNSAEQAMAGRAAIDLEGLSSREKEKIILQRGIPFLTLLHLRGHIMLYVGSRGGRALAFHNLWGVRTKSFWGREGRHIVGQAVITTLSPGMEMRNADPDAEILRRIDRMVFLVNPADGLTR